MRRALAVTTLLLLLTACGGGEDEKAAYVADAKAVCEDAVEEFEQLTVPTTPEGFGEYADSLVGVIEEAHHDLAGLTPPEDDRAPSSSARPSARSRTSSRRARSSRRRCVPPAPTRRSC